MSDEFGSGNPLCVVCDAPANMSVGGVHFCSRSHQSDYFDRKCIRERARGEYEAYKRHGRPNGPYYMKCLECGDVYEKDNLVDADAETRYHSGYHGGLLEEDAEIVVTDNTGRELWRHHAIHTPDGPPTCDSCGEPTTGRDRVSCPNCGAIPEEARL